MTREDGSTIPIDIAAPSDDVYVDVYDDGASCSFTINAQSPRAADKTSAANAARRALSVRVREPQAEDFFAGASMRVTATTPLIAGDAVVTFFSGRPGGDQNHWISVRGTIASDAMPKAGDWMEVTLTGVELRPMGDTLGKAVLNGRVHAEFRGATTKSRGVRACPQVPAR